LCNQTNSCFYKFETEDINTALNIGLLDYHQLWLDEDYPVALQIANERVALLNMPSSTGAIPVQTYLAGIKMGVQLDLSPTIEDGDPCSKQLAVLGIFTISNIYCY
jgi:hypothetical protein